MGTMDLVKVLIVVFMLCIGAFTVPVLVDAISSVGPDEPLKPLLNHVPTILVLCLAIFPIWYLWER